LIKELTVHYQRLEDRLVQHIPGFPADYSDTLMESKTLHELVDELVDIVLRVYEHVAERVEP
jgi:hypothetical protein